MQPRIQVESANGITHIRMDDGKVNAMSAALLGDLHGALDDAERTQSIVVLRGRPGMFSAGFDFATFARGRDATLEMVESGIRLIQRFLSFPRPILTACTGHAYPMGAFLMLAADVRLGIQGPWRIGLNEVAIGITVPGFAVELARHRLSPPGFARIQTAALFEPDEARRHGYLDRVVAPEALDAAVEEQLDKLRALHMDSFGPTKQRINEPVLRAIAAAHEQDRASAQAA